MSLFVEGFVGVFNSKGFGELAAIYTIMAVGAIFVFVFAILAYKVTK